RLVSSASRTRRGGIVPPRIRRSSIPGTHAPWFAGDDQPTQPVQQKAGYAAWQERQHPQDTDNGGIDAQVLGHTGRNTREHAVAARPIESSMEAHGDQTWLAAGVLRRTAAFSTRLKKS